MCLLAVYLQKWRHVAGCEWSEFGERHSHTGRISAQRGQGKQGHATSRLVARNLRVTMVTSGSTRVHHVYCISITESSDKTSVFRDIQSKASEHSTLILQLSKSQTFGIV